MFNYIIHSSIYMKAILTCCFLGTISFSVLEIAYFSMIRSTAHIGRAKEKWLKDLKKKYEDYHEMNVKVNNVNTFVDKLFRKKKICGLTTSFWITLEHLAIAGCAISGAAGALIISQQGKDLSQVMICYLTGITAACGLLFLDTFLRAEEKKHIVISNMNDYLENVLENSFRGRRADTAENVAEVGVGPAASYEDRDDIQKNQSRIIQYAERKRETRHTDPVSLMSDEEERLLEDVLQEFFA